MDTSLTHTPLLTNKHAVIFGAGGAVGTAVAKEFAAQGATVFLSLIPTENRFEEKGMRQQSVVEAPRMANGLPFHRAKDGLREFLADVATPVFLRTDFLSG
jgi:NAD(P)-dependent dehydrogenase (short-subunit alcohol dehydrogenase family)